MAAKEKTNKNQKEKSVRNKNSSSKASNPLSLDWGILTGVNSAGSFTAKNQNANFYGSAPVDLFFGVFAAWNINAKILGFKFSNKDF